ncbi:hypothetical protein MPSEU_000007200 [Mayamaea pseudoterrestris]|nr:hypothetical protein MPSEU_000007200 [Mayamaea pseudoterrestris]
MDQQESVEQAKADLEMLLAAYPDEIEVDESTRQKLLATAHDATCFFPLQWTLHLSSSARIILEIVKGYPAETNIQISSYRSSPDEKNRMDDTVSIVRSIANQCLEDGVEGSFACVSAALDTWNSQVMADGSMSAAPLDESRKTEPTRNRNEMTTHQNACSPCPTESSSNAYTWITGEPLHDRKSTFVAHVCRLHCEADVQPALQQLLSSNNKLQKATHNMWTYRILETVPHQQKASSKPSIAHLHETIIHHDSATPETATTTAGSRLGHLLELRRETNVLVVVSRWFGGISLGPKRFAHINNVARELLVHCHENIWK